MSKPNVLIFCSDEHARRYTGLYGHPAVQTPTLDRLADRGTTFSNAYSPSPICVPARASLATGRQVHEIGCWSSAQAYHGQTESWMHRARDHGCAVLSFGKLHFRSCEDDNGFTEELLPMHLANNGIGWPLGLLRDPLPEFKSAHELAERTGCGESDYTEYDREITAAACNWLRKYGKSTNSKPWVLFVSFVSPHYPLTAPDAFYKLYQDNDKIGTTIPKPNHGYAEHPVLQEMRSFWKYDDYFTEELRIDARKNYFGLISFLDDNIRQVLEALEDCRSVRETLVLYTSDHGEMLGHLGFWGKSVMYEDSVGIPLLAAGRGFQRQTSNAPVSLTNISNTILEAIGAESAGAGNCLDESLQCVVSTPAKRRFALSQYHDGGTPVGFFMIRENNWKLVHYAGGYPPQLFNLTEDPLELNDLAQNVEYRSHLENLTRRLYQVIDPNEVIEQYSNAQTELISALGGRDNILSMWDFNHTPVE